jgi:hypothetical protein
MHTQHVSLPLGVWSLSRSRVCHLSSLLTHALIKLNPKTATPPQNMLWMHGMQKCRSFKIIASRLKRCSNWCCHVYSNTYKCLQVLKVTKWDEIWHLSKCGQVRAILKEGSPPKVHIANIDRRSTLCYICMQSELPQTKFTHHVMRQTCGLIKL